MPDLRRSKPAVSRFVAMLVLAMFTAGAGPAQQACGSADTPCETAAGRYHIQVPDTAGPHPAMVFLHGYGGRGGSLLNGSTAREALSRGYAFIAPDGLVRPGGRRTSWSFHPIFFRYRDEAAFLREVLQDAADRFDIDPGRAVLAGFSIGGSMASYIACETPEDFFAYAPVSGSFWRPHPESCAAPVRLLHTHGWQDRVVPLEGRVIRQVEGRDFAQGDVFRAMQLWRRANRCTGNRPDVTDTNDRFWRRKWTNCAPGSALELALFDGGHGIPRGWSQMVFDWLEELSSRTALSQ